ncbi:hypothetical protein IEQ34_016286 [Dendrobium chrysotoxum]|uniref:Uncharacterized protein n=1 Tax=Dendrobium chrysotoxum TaxID=161865 RepID=A0AAV7GDW4_DENCH|nr:hypothetical protein IEQ34_016286 [Dendrobium chrysotoxum]
MKKFRAICCGSSDINVERPRRLVRRSKKTPKRSSGETSDKSNEQVLWAKKYPNSYSVSDARFLTDGDPHSIVISFEGEERTQMKLMIDDEMVYEVETKETLRGKLELTNTSDGMVVDFFWDLVEIPKKFSFYTRELSSNTRTVVGSSSRGGIEEEIAYYLDPWQFSYRHVHALEILGC